MYDEEPEYFEENPEYFIDGLVYEAIATHNEIIIIELIKKLESDYIEIASLATMGQYKKNWTHLEVLDYITYET